MKRFRVKFKSGASFIIEAQSEVYAVANAQLKYFQKLFHILRNSNRNISKSVYGDPGGEVESVKELTKNKIISDCKCLKRFKNLI